ncbi:MAG: TonB-dependent receptor [Acidobacteria bacterium]|nr:TonB-dependent receptor [Acidobacteriota bacterium]
MNDRYLVRSLAIALLTVGLGCDATAQEQTGTVRVEVVTTAGEPVADAEVIAAGVTYQTDELGVAVLAVPAGSVQVTVVQEGFVPISIPIDVVAGREQRVSIELAQALTVEEEVTVVASTRTERRIEDQAMRVEVLNREEVEEKMLMTPGDIGMMLNETGGLRVQTTAPSLGGSSVRIQGMRGRYTRFLSDGLPVFGSQPSGLGLLQIPPMDLSQVEVVKGVASALYGAGALGGVVNLLSRRPGDEPERELLVNQSTRGATDGILWLSAPLSDDWGVTFLGGGHVQDQTDVDGDGWSELAHYERGVVRPRLFWDDGQGQSFFLTVGTTLENRNGGTQPGAVLPATGLPYPEGLETRRVDVGLLWQTLAAGRYVVTTRATSARQWHDHQFGKVREEDRHSTDFAEVTLRGSTGAQTWVGGVAVERDAYDPTTLPQFAYTYTTPGVFVQDDVDVRPWLALSMSGRLDRHSEYGTFFSPRVSALLRSDDWSTRISTGSGFFGPSVLTEETVAAGLTRLQVNRPLQAERGRSVSIDLTRTQGPFSVTGTLFGSRVANPIKVDRATYVLENLVEPTTNIGAELLGLFRQAPFAVTASYTYVQSRETEGGVTSDVELTPRHSIGLVGMWENENGRVGIEWYYTGRQRLEDNPYRGTSEPYNIVGILIERRVGPLRLFVNGENLTDTRQTRWDDPFLRPERAADGRWTVDAWAPLDGRVINGGVRVGF